MWPLGQARTGRAGADRADREGARPHGPAFGLTEDNAEPALAGKRPGGCGGGPFQVARRELSALHPRYLRLLVDWAALQPSAAQPAALEAQRSGCARDVGPCAAYAGLRDELAAIAAQQRATRAAGAPGFEVVLDLFGTPAWAAKPASGCELPGTRPFSRPLDAAAISSTGR